MDDDAQKVWPGSKLWAVYRRAHLQIETFLHGMIPALSNRNQNAAVLQSCWSSNFRMLTVDTGWQYLDQGCWQGVPFFQSLVAWRQRTRAMWNLRAATVLEWKERPTIQLQYTTRIPLPGGAGGASNSIRLQGTDVYILFKPSSDVGY